MIIIVAAIAGIARLVVQQRREQKMHLLDDFRPSLERLARQPLPAYTSPTTGAPSAPRSASRRASRRPESPRGEWDRIAPQPSPAVTTGVPPGAVGDAAESFFAPGDEPLESQDFDSGSRRPRRPRRERKPLLAGRLWRKPREPWLWTYEKSRRPAAVRSRRVPVEVAYSDFGVDDDVLYETQGSLARSPRSYGSRSSHSGPGFVGPHDSLRRSHDAARPEVGSRRVEARRATRARLS